ncbi:MBL fold metallo-hydrolase [Haloplanus salinus]|jgi:ribonuclease BN (tRNA processing enzyme)|uniref:MBL fold metallo-hydrolase n=1 Tax=Haloplanus salinus TaxID=1126245 RepID=A0A368N7B9_9EURY|nr:MBL fold metallo-hydrolase [Haloplanus salinus]RCU45933.1 MBL fold metallo-hydrolase [Haloplanus salinus]
MRLTFLGTGSAMPLPDRAQTGLLLERDDRRVLVDCGAGVLGRLAATDPGYEGVSTVLLTHRHLDHVSDLLALVKARWLAGNGGIEVVGPSGTKALVDDLFDAFDYLDGRVDVRVREVGAHDFSVAGFDASAHETRHSVDGLAYRFEGDGDEGDLTISSDTEAFEGLASFADGSAVFVHDCSFPDDVDVSNHPTPAKLGAALAGHDYGRVYLTHLYPHTEGRHEEMLESLERRYDGDVRFARDGLRVEV